MQRRTILAGLAALPVLGRAGAALADDRPLKVGLIVPMTGPFASYGPQMENGMRLYLAEHGDSFAGRRVELVVADDGGIADQTRRIAQEMVTTGGVEVLAGFGLTPLAMAAAQVSTRARVAQFVLVAATSSVTEKSPYIVRTSYTTPQVTSQIAAFTATEGVTRAMTLVLDYGPGQDAEATFVKDFTAAGGEVLGSLRVPMQNPDFAPYLQKVADTRPEVLFVFVPSGIGAGLLKQFVERGLDKQGVRIVADGSATDDFQLPQMGDEALGLETGFVYSADHDSALNAAFRAAYLKASGGVRPSFIAVAAYDAAHLIALGLKATGGDASGPALVEAIRGASWESPRGPVSIDAQTRDIVQDVWMRRVERKADGQLWNVEFRNFPAIRDPGKG